MIIVCPLSKLYDLVARHKPARVISLLDPDFEFPELGPDYVGGHLQLQFHDVHDAEDDMIAPSPEHVDRLLAFVADMGTGEHLLVHCHAGIGRSPAAAFVAACALSPRVSELELAMELRRASPCARPNQVLVELADSALRRDGRMIDAIVTTGRDLPRLEADEGVPFVLQRIS